MKKDRHLNIFDHYRNESESLPFENDLTRGLAILLIENPFLFYQFLDLVKNKYGINGDFLTEPNYDYEVSIQRNTEEISHEEFRNILGVSLTAKEIYNITKLTKDKETGAANSICDLIIKYDDNLIIVEVKRDETDCTEQLKKQIEETKKRYSLTEVMDRGLVSLSWIEIIELLEKNILFNNDKSIITRDYRDYLVNNFPEWKKVNPLNHQDSIKENESTIIERFNQVMRTLVNDKNEENKTFLFNFDQQIENGIIYFKDPISSYIERLNISFNYDEDNKIGTIDFKVWPCDTKGQWNSYVDKAMQNSFKFSEDKLNNKKIYLAGLKSTYSVKPYLKFSTFKSTGRLWVDLKLCKNADDYAHWEYMLGKKVKNEFDGKLEEFIRKNGIGDTEKNLSNIRKTFENNDSYNLSIGFECTFSIPYCDFQKKDEEGTLGISIIEISNGIVEFIKSGMQNKK